MLKDKLRAFIVENYLYGEEPSDLTDDTSFLDAGIIDSTGVMELILFLEQEFGISVGDTEMVPENLDSLDCLCRYLQGKGVDASGTAAGAEPQG